MQPISISVIVPIFNAATTLRLCLKGLQQQSFKDFEVLLIDNGSSDKSLDIVKEFPEFQLLHQSIQGSYSARNCGINQAQGEILAFLDPDCIPVPEWLSLLWQDFQKPQLQLILGSRHFPGKSHSLQLLNMYEEAKAQHTLQGSDAGVYFGYTNNMAVRSQVFKTLGNFQELIRGADSLFVNKVAFSLGIQAIAYNQSIAVTHLEIQQLSDYYTKIILYSFYRARTQRPASLSRQQRWQVYLLAVKQGKLSLIQAVHLLLLLIFGLILWQIAYSYGIWQQLITRSHAKS